MWCVAGLTVPPPGAGIRLLMLVNAPGEIRVRAQRIADAPGGERLAAKAARLLRLFAERLVTSEPVGEERGVHPVCDSRFFWRAAVE